MIVLALVITATPITLEEVRALARQNLDAVRSELALTRAGIDRADARAPILPQVSLNMGVSERLGGPQRLFTTAPQLQPDGSLSFVQRAVDIPSFAQGNFQLQLAVNQLLYDGGRWWNQLARTGAFEEAAKGQLAEQQAASELEAVRRFFELLRAQVVLKTLESQVKRSEEQVARAKALFEAGRGSKSDVLVAEVSLGTDQINAIRQVQSLISARVALLQWLGQGLREVEAQAPKGFEAPLVPVTVAEATLLESARKNRPLFQVLEAQARGTRLGVDIARADYLPRVSANAAYQRTSPSAELFFDPGRQHAVSFGATLAWDLFSGFATNNQVDRATVQLTELERQQRQALIELETEIARLAQAYGAQAEITKIATRNHALATENLRSEEQRFAAGASTSVLVREAQNRSLAAELNLVQTRVDVEVAKAALERLTAAPLDS